MITVSIEELLTAAKGLVSEPSGSEYERGQLDLIANVFGTDGLPTDERMGELAEELGWPDPNDSHEEVDHIASLKRLLRQSLRYIPAAGDDDLDLREAIEDALKK